MMMKRRVNRPQESLTPYYGKSSSYQEKDKSSMSKTLLTGRHNQVLLVLAVGAILSVIYIHTPTFSTGGRARQPYNVSYTGPPAGLVVRPTVRKQYTPVPENCKHTFYVASYVDFRLPVIRALRGIGWTMTTNERTAHVIWDKLVQKERYPRLHPWQRYNHIPGFGSWDRKDGFAKGFQEYRERNPGKKLLFLPETYILGDEEGQRAFEQRLDEGGMEHPWVLKVPSVNNGKGIEMLGANSRQLQHVIHRVRSEIEALERNQTGPSQIPAKESAQGDSVKIDQKRGLRRNNSKWQKKKHSDYIVQAFVCNELTWFGKRKFDFRMHWMVPSIDPLIVLYTDGFARIGNAVYDETDFSDTTKHLTTMTFLDEEFKGTMDEAKGLIHQHYEQNVAILSKRFKGDPYQHVRNQMKEAIAETVTAFKNKTFGNDKTTILTAENGFSLYGADFVIDNNLDVWYLESQAGPGMIEDYDFKVTMHRQLLRTTFNVMQEIQDKIEANPHASVLPLDSDIEGWDIVYAGDWMYQYYDYQRQPTKESCRLAQNKPQVLADPVQRFKERTGKNK